MGAQEPIRGLVLEGGGAKGAWQFGVLQALAENGVQFAVVSGTSVGALNGAIWCADQMDIGKKMWQSMSLWRVFALRSLLLPFVIMGLVSRVFYAVFQGYAPRETKGERLSYLLCSFLLSVTPISGYWGFAIHHHMITDDSAGWNAFFVIWGAVISVFFLYMFFTSDSQESRSFFWTSGFFFWAIAFLDWPLDDRTAPNGIVWVGALPLLLLLLAWFLRVNNVSMFTPRPLAKTIRAVLSGGLRVPLFAATAKESGSYYDPDNLDFEPVRLTAESMEPVYVPISLSTLVAVYSRVDALDSNAAGEALLASSALPLGIVAARKADDGTRLVDGGTADNLPWFPLIAEYPCDEVVIVHCNPVAARSDEPASLSWQMRDRLFRVLELKFRASNSKSYSPAISDPPRNVPYRAPAHWPAKITHIAPERTLGSILTGTLDFSRKNCRKRMQDGYEAGIREIRKNLTNRV